jgi:hypothetical protein
MVGLALSFFGGSSELVLVPGYGNMRKYIILIGLAASVGAISYGSPSFCSTTAPGTDLTTLNSGGGCSQDDVIFSGFTVTTGGVNSVTAPGEADVSMYGSGANPAVTALFDTPGTSGAPTWQVSTSGDQMDSILSYTASTTGMFTQLGVPLTEANFSGSGSSMTITVSYCLGVTTVSGGCESGANGGSFEVEVAGSAVFFNTGPVSLNSGFNTIAIQNEIVINNGYALLSLPNELDETFADTPEPTTFVLMGSALAGLAFLRYRRRGTSAGTAA